MDKSSIGALADRLEILEREARLWRWGGGLALLAGLVVVVGGAQKANDPKVIEADGFIVRDKDGKERIRLGFASDGKTPVLSLRARDGNDRVLLQAGEEADCGSLYLFGSGEGLSGLSVALDGDNRSGNSPSLMLRHDEKRRINLNVTTSPEHPWLRVEDEKGILFQAPEPIVKLLGRP
jgi:hypothetical protein